MTAVRWHGSEYELINVLEDGKYVLRDDTGDVLLTDGVELDRQTVEVKCERCGRWSTHAIPVGARWVCADRSCYYAEQAASGAPEGTQLDAVQEDS